jgi:hypothetical protein
MLNLPLDTLGFIIMKAREFNAGTAPVVEDSGSNPTDDAVRHILQDTADNPTRVELVDAIESLSNLEKVELLALMWLGRGNFSKEEWQEALDEAGRAHDEKTTDYLVGTPLLADYLEEGLLQLGYTIEGSEIRFG